MKDLIKKILKKETEDKDLIVPYRLEDRSERYKRIIYKKIQEYIKNGSVGSLWLSESPIETLPSNLKYVGGSLLLDNSKILELPEDLKIKEGLDLQYSMIEKLPVGLSLSGFLNLEGTMITNLPSDLKVSGINLNYSQISNIPSGLKIDVNLWLLDTPLSNTYNKKEIRQMIEDTGGYVKGKIYSKF